MSNPLRHLAEVVTVALNDAGLSENTAAQRTGISRSTLKRRLLTGDFTYGELWQIADLLNDVASAKAAAANTTAPAKITPAKIQARAEKRAA